MRISALALVGLAAVGLLVSGSSLSAQAVRSGTLPTPLPLFPPDNWWNVNISAAPLDTNSAAFISFIGTTRALHPDFGGDEDPSDPNNTNIYGMVYISVPGTQALQPVTFVEFGSQSDNGSPGRPNGYPIPTEARTQPRWIEGGEPGGGSDGDHHMLIVDRDNRILYELYHAFWNPTLSRWQAGSGAIYALDANGRRPEGWTSADAAGLAILPGLIRYDEAFGTVPIKHAFRFTTRDTNGHVYPASHTACNTCAAAAPPMGTRLRLKASVNLSGYTPEVQRIFQAMKTYGLILADNGSDMYIQGAYDTRWNNDVLNPAFGSLHASDFEVVQRGWRSTVATTTGTLQFHTVSPCRLLDSRDPFGAWGGPALPPTGQRVIRATGRCGIPATAKAISTNISIVNAGQAGHLRSFPGDFDTAAVPNAFLINFGAGQTRTNNAILKLSSSGTGTFGLQNFTTSAFTHIVVDVNGWFE